MDLTCPKCQATMRGYERNGVTVDQCSECRGIFLDRGELERLTDAESQWHGEQAPYQTSVRGRDDHRGHDDHRGGHHDNYRGGYQKKRKKSFLEELFD